MPKNPVLVTGGSGFIAGHCILHLLAAGHEVRTTIRSPSGEAAIRKVLERAGASRLDMLSFAGADLMRDAGWAEAMAGVSQVLHVASPVHPGHVDNEDAVIGPAREGTLRVLRAARDGGVKRVVLTSAFHAVGWGRKRTDHVFTEADWTVLDGPGVDAYGRSKTIAEQAAWDFVANADNGPELTSLLPVAVMGPIMGRSISGSNHVIQRLLAGTIPALPNLFFPIVDVRDVASAHVAAMTHPDAAGERLLLSNGPALAMREIAAILRAELGADAGRAPTRSIPDPVLRVMGLFNPEIAAMLPELGHARKTSNDKARQLLDWRPRAPRAAIVAAGRSMIEAGLIQPA